jgi:hypothetical protein
MIWNNKNKNKFPRDFILRLGKLEQKKSKKKRPISKEEKCRQLRHERIKQLERKYGNSIVAVDWADDGITELELSYELERLLAHSSEEKNKELIRKEFNERWQRKRKHYDYERRIINLPQEQRRKLLRMISFKQEEYMYRTQHGGGSTEEYNAIRTHIIDDYFDKYHQQPPAGWMDVKRYSS